MIAYTSRTGNVRYIISKLNLPSIEIKEDTLLDKMYILLTFTDGLGNIPPLVEAFLERNHELCQGVIASGNTNFGTNFCGSADKISEQYGIPIIHKIDLRGTPKDYTYVIEQYKRIIEGWLNETILKFK